MGQSTPRVHRRGDEAFQNGRSPSLVAAICFLPSAFAMRSAASSVVMTAFAGMWKCHVMLALWLVCLSAIAYARDGFARDIPSRGLAG
jgi:hypothetical protein